MYIRGFQFAEIDETFAGRVTSNTFYPEERVGITE